MGKSKGPHVRHKTRDNKTIETYRDHHGKEGLDHLKEHPIKAQVTKEFIWLFSKSTEEGCSEKYIKKMGNWCRVHPDQAVEYLFDTSVRIASEMDITDAEEKIDMLAFFIRKFDVEFLLSRYSMQSRLSELRGRDNEKR